MKTESTTESDSPILSKDVRQSILSSFLGALAVVLIDSAITFIRDKQNFHWPRIEEMPNIISNVYEYAPIPLRIAYFAWITLLILYSYAERFDWFHRHLPRVEKQRNFRPWVFGVLAALAVLNHLMLKNPSVNSPFLYSATNLWGSITIGIGYGVLALGFYIVYLARPVINGYWGPHLYEYKNEEHNKLIDRNIYGSFRHPIYLGQILMSCGTFLLANNWIAILFPLYMIIANTRRANKEEQHLLEIFGEQYHEYKERTGKWLPKWPSVFKK